MSVPFNPYRGMITTTAQLTGPTGRVYIRLALDTGATRTVIRPEKLIAVGYNPAAATRQQHTTTGSGTVVVPLVTIDKIEAIGQEQIGLTILAHALPSSVPVDGLLGLDFLRGRDLNINFRTGQITLQ